MFWVIFGVAFAANVVAVRWLIRSVRKRAYYDGHAKGYTAGFLSGWENAYGYSASKNPANN